MNSILIAGIMIGAALGLAVGFPAGLLSYGHRVSKERRADLAASNILRGYTQAASAMSDLPSTGRHAAPDSRAEAPWPVTKIRPAFLDDAEGAFAQASAAYTAIYPGNTGKYDEPDQAWLEFVGLTQQHYLLGRTGANSPRPVTAWVTWSPTEKALAHIVWFVLSTTGTFYPWWQKLADRIWEWSMVVEYRVASTHRWQQAALDRFLNAAGNRTLLVAEKIVQGLVLLGGGPPPLEPSVRPKRYYPIKQG